MKFLIISLCVVFMVIQVCSAALDENKMASKIPTASKTCKEKTGISQEKIDKARKGEIDDEDPTLKKHLKCFYEYLQILEENEIHVDKLKSYLRAKDTPEEIIKQIVEDCKVPKNDTAAVELAKCISEHKKK